MWLTEKQVQRIKQKYSVGTRVRMINMQDPFPISKGVTGTIEDIDDQGQLHMKWDNGRGLPLVPDVDDFEIISKPVLKSSDMRIIIVDPMSEPRVAIINNELESMQSIVGGFIETKELDGNTVLIANENGMLLNLEANRKVGSSIIAGTFFLAGNDGSENFVSLTDDQIDTYMGKYAEIEEYTQEEMLKSTYSMFMY